MSTPSMVPARGALHVASDPAALADDVAGWFAEQVRASEGPFIISLAGGSTPRGLYERLAGMTLPWERIHFVFGDERFVPPDDPASNFGMVRGALFSRAPVPPGNVHAVPTVGVTLDEAASAYAATLRGLARPGRPLLDVTFLGLGDDGHTASLLPGQPATEERSALVVGVGHGRPEPRITLTFPALEDSGTVAFLVTGEGKRAILDRVLSGADDVPAGRLRPKGALLWFADRAAAGRWADAG
jgi:6-phosphogluconolactonase